MPKFSDDATLEQFHIGAFTFTGQNIEELESSGLTLADIVIDVSGSTESFLPQMVIAMKEAIIALRGDPARNIKPDPRADSIMMRVTAFSREVTEIIGYTLIANIDLDAVANKIKSISTTSLFDAIVDTSKAAKAYATALRIDDYDVNGILVVIADGLNNSGSLSAGWDEYTRVPRPSQSVLDTQLAEVADHLSQLRRSEVMESYVSLLIGVNVSSCKDQLEEIQQKAGFTNELIALESADAKTIQKIGKFVSDSVSSQSQARGTGGPSQSIARAI